MRLACAQMADTRGLWRAYLRIGISGIFQIRGWTAGVCRGKMADKYQSLMSIGNFYN